MELYLESRQMKSLVDLLDGGSAGKAGGEEMELSIEQFRKALEHVDFQVKNLPATAQVNPLIILQIPFLVFGFCYFFLKRV